jgi:hypothetical protein
MNPTDPSRSDAWLLRPTLSGDLAESSALDLVSLGLDDPDRELSETDLDALETDPAADAARVALRTVGSPPMIDLDSIYAAAGWANNSPALASSSASNTSARPTRSHVEEATPVAAVRSLDDARARRRRVWTALPVAASITAAAIIGASVLRSTPSSETVALESSDAVFDAAAPETAAGFAENAAPAPVAADDDVAAETTVAAAAASETVPAAEAEQAAAAAPATVTAAEAPPPLPDDSLDGARFDAPKGGDEPDLAQDNGVKTEKVPQPAPEAPSPGEPFPPENTLPGAATNGDQDTPDTGGANRVGRATAGGADIQPGIPMVPGGPFLTLQGAVIRVQTVPAPSAAAIAAQSIPRCAAVLQTQARTKDTPFYLQTEIAGEVVVFGVFVNNGSRVIVAVTNDCQPYGLPTGK